MTSMPSPGRSRRSARTALAAGVAACALAALTACEKPTPVATVTIGSDSVHSEASCWNDGRKLSDDTLKKCSEGADHRSITFDQGQKIRFGVDPEIAEKGWQVFLANQEITEATTKTYTTFPGEQLRMSALPDETDLVIAQVNSAGGEESDGFYGLWHFTVVKGE